MSLTETKVIDQITVVENGAVLYREATRITRDGELIAQTFHRTTLTPGQDLTNQSAQVVAVCNAVWTQDVVAAYQTEQSRLAAEQAAFEAALAQQSTQATA